MHLTGHRESPGVRMCVRGFWVCLRPHLCSECRVCVCARTLTHTHTRHILERRRTAALCMMKPCIGYDFCLSDIHIHAWLSGRLYKIVAAAQTA